MTDIESAFLRGFRALSFGIPINCIVLGWVNLAMVKILMLVLGVDKFTAIVVVLFLIGINLLDASVATLGLGMLALSVAAGYYIYRDLSKRGWSSIAE